VAGQIKVREMRLKRYKSPSYVVDRRSFADRDGLLPTRYVLAASRMSSGVRVLWLGIASGWCPVGGVSRIVKTASSRGHSGRTLFGHGDCCSPQARPRGAL